MGQPFVGEIRMFGGNFAPAGWMFCDGQMLPISENETLFQLIGTTYGGDGQETFQLPNLQSRIPIHQGTQAGTTYVLAEAAGTESVTLSIQQIPNHNHPLLATSASGSVSSPSGNVLALPSAPATVVNPLVYGTDAPQVALSPNAVGPQGGSLPHDNMQPFLCINYIISLFGIFPHQ